jgi:hypothetical protein
MTPRTLYDTILELGCSINLLYRSGLLLPSMMMIYATIDVLGALARPAGAIESTGDDFRVWVERYLLPGSHLPLTANDLWGARCGLLHTYTPESRDSRRGKARKLLYVAGRLDESARDTTQLVVGEYVVVVSQDLFDALSKAFQRFIDDLERDADLAERVTARAGEFLVPWVPE